MVVLVYHPKCRDIAEEIGLPEKAILHIESCTDAKKMAGLLRAMSESPSEFMASLPIDKAVTRAEIIFKKLKELVEVDSCLES